MRRRPSDTALVAGFMLTISVVTAWHFYRIEERIDRVERLQIDMSCAVLRKLHWDDPTSPDCAQSTSTN